MVLLATVALGFVLVSLGLSHFRSRLVANMNAVSGGIWAKVNTLIMNYCPLSS